MLQNMKRNFNPVYLFIIFFLLSSKIFAQKDTIYFDKDWQIVSKENALYYRIKPSKIKTKKAVGYNIKNIDSLFVINDYYIKTNTLQFKGYSEDYNANYLAGKAEWFNENGNKIDTKDFNYKNINHPKFKLPELPIFYLDFKVANKSLLTGGLEFCLDCKNKDKLLLGAGFGITNSYNGNYYGVPDIHLSYNKNLLFLKTGSSHKNAYVLGGFSLLNLIDLGIGYSFPYSNEKTPLYKGFTTGITLRFNGERHHAYQTLKMF